MLRIFEKMRANKEKMRRLLEPLKVAIDQFSESLETKSQFEHYMEKYEKEKIAKVNTF